MNGFSMRSVLAAAMVAAMAAPLAAQPSLLTSQERRGLLGVTLSCDDCVIMRGVGRVAYARRPAFSSVTRSGAAGTAGIQSGDTLYTVDGLDVLTPEGFERFVQMRPNVPVRIGVRRAGQEREFTVTPNEGGTTMSSYYNQRLRTAQVMGAEALRSSFRSPLGWLDVGLECEGCSIMAPSASRRAWTFRTPPAVYTVGVDGPAHRAGLRRGDTLTHIDGVDLTTSQGGRAFANLEPNQRVTLTVRRDGRSRQVPLTAVPRPDASNEEIAAFEEYRRMRDSSNAVYRDALTATTARAQEELRQIETLLRAEEARGSSAEESRRRIQALDSMIRTLRELERARARASATTGVWDLSGSFSPVVVAPTPPVAAFPAEPAIPPRAGVLSQGGNYPLRYSGRLGNLVNVDVRAAGAPYVQEMGDSLIVIVMPGGGEVRVATRPQGGRR